jgi:hypothetical protein
MDIHEIKFIKGAYGHENLECCAFSSKAGRALESFKKIYNYLLNKQLKTGDSSTWIAIYIPKSSRKYREEIGLPSISRYEGYVSAFQELVIHRGLNYKEYGINDRWDYGIPSKRIFAFKEPKIRIEELFDKDNIKSFYSAATSSAAYNLKENQENFLLSSISNDDLEEVKVQQDYVNFYPKVLKRLNITN